MDNFRNYPLLVFAGSFVAFWLSARAGVIVRNRQRPIEEDDRKDFSTVIAATLTLLGLIIAFSCSMAISRFDQRKNCEAEEANAIGTEYARAGLLAPSDAGKVRALLTQYVRERIRFYDRRYQTHFREIDTETTGLETELWSTVQNAAEKERTPILGLVIAGMNDVLNNRGYTRAARWNRIPVAAWSLMIIMGILCNFLVGYGAHRKAFLRKSAPMFLILPLSLISCCLIADNR